jgi:transposase
MSAVGRVRSLQAQTASLRAWARPGSGFTLLMEALIVTLCQAMTVRAVAQLLAVSDMRLGRTLDHYVEQARAQEDFSGVTAVGLDETAARRGHAYISLFHDLQAGRLLFGCEGRKGAVVAQFADDLEAHGGCAENVRAVCIDMSASYQAGVAEHLPWADVTFDAFPVIQLVNTAVDAVRRQEAKATPSLKRSRYLWLKDTRDWIRRQILHLKFPIFPQATRSITAAIKRFRVALPLSWQSIPKPCTPRSLARARRRSPKAYSVRLAVA